MLRLLLPLLLAASAHGHGAMITPRTRNSVDYLVGVNSPKDWPSNWDCTNISGVSPSDCHNGQAGFYYSQGCFIGCPTCDHMSGRRQIDLCGLGKAATINDPHLRSVNRNATAGSLEDIYRHNPWRAPGSAPVADACGLAGGTPWLPEVGEAGDYTATKFAHHGMNGTELHEMDTGVVWTVGLEAEVTWQVLNNHGGGDSDRLCPADRELTEECFQEHPLDFVPSKQAIVTRNNTLIPVDGVFVSQGTYPPGSMWSMIPLPPDWLGPRCLAGPNDTDSTPYGCQDWEKNLVDGECEPCPETPGSDCSRCDNHAAPAFVPPCDGCQGSDHHHAIRDIVKVPSTLAPGKYVLGWRWDCEATAQVWSNCADVTLVL
eukprot:TRINITY_DN13521_c0_g1_i5.p1 TRINITY_DN13521_c0_g1~~TRINITY_DN13521_c0_g1_i5.p1  ORF type:complete len:373 (-),score=70.98 TRINITY_DN13521_c0_g1_i5:444-1562(-)